MVVIDGEKYYTLEAANSWGMNEEQERKVTLAAHRGEEWLKKRNHTLVAGDSKDTDDILSKVFASRVSKLVSSQPEPEPILVAPTLDLENKKEDKGKGKGNGNEALRKTQRTLRSTETRERVSIRAPCPRPKNKKTSQNAGLLLRAHTLTGQLHPKGPNERSLQTLGRVQATPTRNDRGKRGKRRGNRNGVHPRHHGINQPPDSRERSQEDHMGYHRPHAERGTALHHQRPGKTRQRNDGQSRLSHPDR